MKAEDDPRRVRRRGAPQLGPELGPVRPRRRTRTPAPGNRRADRSRAGPVSMNNGLWALGFRLQGLQASGALGFWARCARLDAAAPWMATNSRADVER